VVITILKKPLLLWFYTQCITFPATLAQNFGIILAKYHVLFCHFRSIRTWATPSGLRPLAGIDK
jgi:hypothetical protein